MDTLEELIPEIKTFFETKKALSQEGAIELTEPDWQTLGFEVTPKENQLKYFPYIKNYHNKFWLDEPAINQYYLDQKNIKPDSILRNRYFVFVLVMLFAFCIAFFSYVYAPKKTMKTLPEGYNNVKNLCNFSRQAKDLSFSFPCNLVIQEQQIDNGYMIFARDGKSIDLNNESAIFISAVSGTTAEKLAAERRSTDSMVCTKGTVNQMDQEARVAEMPAYHFSETNCLGNSDQYFFDKDKVTYSIMLKYTDQDKKTFYQTILNSLTIR